MILINNLWKRTIWLLLYSTWVIPRVVSVELIRLCYMLIFCSLSLIPCTVLSGQRLYLQIVVIAFPYHHLDLRSSYHVISRIGGYSIQRISISSSLLDVNFLLYCIEMCLS